jgi:Cdc6-like AAA superfamily ATPase
MATNHSPEVAPRLTATPSTPEKLKSLQIRHTRVQQIMNELETLIYPGSQDSILLVCGPTGVGKTTLARHMVNSALTNAAAEMEDDAGIIPAIYVEAPASGEDNFSWRLFYQRILEQLEGELDLPKTAYGIDPATGRFVCHQGPVKNNLSALRTAVERGLKARKTIYLVVDEAAHIIEQTQRNKLRIQLNALKSLANACGTQIVLVGSYDLHQLMSLSAQIARRTHVLHFNRYRQDRPEDITAFRACVQRFQNTLPELWGNDLMEVTEQLHDNTLGCIGTLNAVLTRAAKLAIKDGKWSRTALERALLNEAQYRQILSEIHDGEEAINPSLRRILPKSSRRPTNERRKAA